VTGKFLDEHPHPVYRSYILDCYAAVSRCPSSGNYDLLMEREPKRYQCLRVPLYDHRRDRSRTGRAGIASNAWIAPC